MTFFRDKRPNTQVAVRPEDRDVLRAIAFYEKRNMIDVLHDAIGMALIHYNTHRRADMPHLDRGNAPLPEHKRSA